MRLVVFGAGGHSLETADLIEALGHEIVCFVDERVTGAHATTGLPVLAALAEVDTDFDGCVIAIGDPAARERIAHTLPEDCMRPVLVHPSASVSRHACIGQGTMVMNNAAVSAAASVGEHVIINVGAFVAHEVSVGSYAHVAPAAQLGGGSRVGESCLIGTAAAVLPGVAVAANCVVGAGSVVTTDIPAGVTVVGCPARAIQSR